MYIELVDSLRCLAPHEETWLVAAVSRFEGRYIIEGTLGCPICQLQYPIREGVAHFAAAAEATDAPHRDAPVVTDEALLARAAALLDLRDPGGVVVLGGSWHAIAASLALSFDVQCLVVNAPAGASLGDGVSGLVVADAIPLAPGMARGAMLDERSATPALLQSVARALRPRGRLIAPAQIALPTGVRELVRDATQWVAEADATASKPVELRRR